VTLRLTAPAIFVASLLLLPFLNKPFTIDDPLFLREAKHALVDPLHPADFEQVWNSGDRQKLSQYLLGGTLPAYVLAPVAALGGREWMAHLYQFLLLSGFLAASVSVVGRLGCDRRQATTVGLLIASNPVTLAMAATCMPDVMAMMFGMAGMDRLLLFRDERRWGAGLASGLLLAAAMLCRASTAPLLLVAALLLMPDTWRRAAECLWPLGVAALVVAVFVSLNRGPAANATVGAAFQAMTSMRNVPRNLVAFLCYQALTGPLLVYALLSRGWKFAGVVAGLVALGVAGSMITGSANLVLYAVPAALGICFVVACVVVACPSEPRPLGNVLPLVVWLGSGMVALPYVHMAAKYLLPGVPAAALLIVLHADRVRQRRYPLTVALLVALGWISGALIVVGDTALASSQRAAVDGLIAPRIRRGLKVWAGGQWAFLAYAEDAGAKALANTPPLPEPGDTIVVSRLDYYGMLDRLPFRRELLHTQADRHCGVFVLNRRFGAGFYSIRFGYLPFAIGCGEVNAYDVYRVLP
jgi:4-amino-4-deoxy-L-arabinose transferase-like glycosyltransferase